MAFIFDVPSAPSGDDPHDAAREASHLSTTRSLARTLKAFIDALNPFKPITLYDASGLVLEVLGRRTGRDFNVGHPFQIFDAGRRSSDRTILVNQNSHILRSLNVKDALVVYGIGDTFDVRDEDKIWLEVDIEEYKPTFGWVKVGKTGEDTGWKDFPEPVKWVGDFPTKVQQKAFLLLGYVVAADKYSSDYDPPGVTVGTGNNAVTVVSLVKTHLLIAETCYKGDTILYPIPWGGAFRR